MYHSFTLSKKIKKIKRIKLKNDVYRYYSFVNISDMIIKTTKGKKTRDLLV